MKVKSMNVEKDAALKHLQVKLGEAQKAKEDFKTDEAKMKDLAEKAAEVESEDMELREQLQKATEAKEDFKTMQIGALETKLRKFTGELTEAKLGRDLLKNRNESLHGSLTDLTEQVDTFQGQIAVQHALADGPPSVRRLLQSVERLE